MRKTISIPEDVNEYLTSLPNASNYIVQLIRADITGKHGISKEEVLRIVKEYLASAERPLSDACVEESVSGFLNL